MACSCAAAKETSNLAVLARVEGDDSQATALCELVLSRLHSLHKLFTLLIHDTTQRLKTARSRVNPSAPTDRPSDNVSERSSALKGDPPAGLYDRARSLTRTTFSPLVKEQICQVALVPAVYDIRSSTLPRRVHAHIQRTVIPEREATLRSI